MGSNTTRRDKKSATRSESCYEVGTEPLKLRAFRGIGAQSFAATRKHFGRKSLESLVARRVWSVTKTEQIWRDGWDRHPDACRRQETRHFAGTQRRPRTHQSP